MIIDIFKKKLRYIYGNENLFFIIPHARYKEQSCAFLFRMVLNFACSCLSLYLTIPYTDTLGNEVECSWFPGNTHITAQYSGKTCVIINSHKNIKGKSASNGSCFYGVYKFDRHSACHYLLPASISRINTLLQKFSPVKAYLATLPRQFFFQEIQNKPIDPLPDV